VNRKVRAKKIRIPEIELMRIIPLSEASQLAGVSARTLARAFPEKIMWASPGRRGMRVGDALQIASDRKALRPP
jgi:hypothetical protein